MGFELDKEEVEAIDLEGRLRWVSLGGADE